MFCTHEALNHKQLTLRPALVVGAATAIMLAFAAGRFLFPFSPKQIPIEVSTTNEQRLNIDSMIAGWMGEQQIGVYDAANMTRLSPPLEGARFGLFTDEVRGLAAEVESLYSVPSAVTLAQFALESRFGLSDLGALNFFGHKFGVAKQYGPRPALSVTAFSREFVNGAGGGEWKMIPSKFARYRSAHECFIVHGTYLFLSPIYKAARQFNHDPILYCREIGKRYATDPSYASKLITIMRRYNLLAG